MGKGDKCRPSTKEGHANYQMIVSEFEIGMGDLKQGQVIKKKGYTIRKMNVGVADVYDEVQKMVLLHFYSIKDHIRFRYYECGCKGIEIPMAQFVTIKEERLLANVQLIMRRIDMVTKSATYYENHDANYYTIRYKL